MMMRKLAAIVAVFLAWSGVASARTYVSATYDGVITSDNGGIKGKTIRIVFVYPTDNLYNTSVGYYSDYYNSIWNGCAGTGAKFYVTIPVWNWNYTFLPAANNACGEILRSDLHYHNGVDGFGVGMNATTKFKQISVAGGRLTPTLFAQVDNLLVQSGVKDFLPNYLNPVPPVFTLPSNMIDKATSNGSILFNNNYAIPGIGNGYFSFDFNVVSVTVRLSTGP